MSEYWMKMKSDNDTSNDDDTDPVPTPTPIIDTSTPFFIEGDSDITISRSYYNNNFTPFPTIEVSSDNINWEILEWDAGEPPSEGTPPSYGQINIFPYYYGGKVYIRAIENSWYNVSYKTTITGARKIGGNIMSLHHGVEFNKPENSVRFSSGSQDTFAHLFSGNSDLVDASDLVLPATELVPGCYRCMFLDCSSLEKAPVLLATKLANRCYEYLFSGCRNLNEVTLYADGDLSTNTFTGDWLSNVSGSGTIYNLGNATLSSGPNGIPTGWVELKEK